MIRFFFVANLTVLWHLKSRLTFCLIYVQRHITATYLTTSRHVWNCLCASLTATNKVYLPKIWEYFSEQMHQGHISFQLIIIASKQHSNAWFDDVSCRCPPSHRTILSMSGWRLLLLCPICSVSCDFYICCWQEVFCTENVCNKLPENISKWNCHSALFSSTFYRFLRSGFLLIILEPLKVRHWNVLQWLSASNSPGQTLEKYFGRFWLTWHKSQ